MTKRKFYRTIIRVEVLTDDPRALTGRQSLQEVDELLTANDCHATGFWTIIRETTMNGKQAAKYLAKDDGSPDVMGLNHKGEDLE